MKKLVFATVCLFFGIALCSCTLIQNLAVAMNEKETEPKTFGCEGLTVELTDEFMTMDFISEDYDLILGDGDVTVLAKHVDLEGDILDSVTPYSYALTFKDELETGTVSDVMTTQDGLSYLEHAVEDDEGVINYVYTFYKDGTGIWFVAFGMDDEVYDECFERCLYYAATVKTE